MGVRQQLFGRDPNWHVALGALGIALVMAWVLTQVVLSLAHRLLVKPGLSREHPQVAAMRALLRGVRAVLLLILTVVLVQPALELVGEPLAGGLRLSTLAAWTLGSGLRVLLIVVLAFLFARAAAIGTSRLERYLNAADGQNTAEHVKRVRTLSTLLRNVAMAFIVATSGVMILDELHVNITPLLTGAGIVGLAIGFGAQTLVKDVISGFFFILENQLRVGDVAEINGTGGLVEAINLRTVVLRDIRGAVHVFPCGSVSTLANLTKDYSFAVLDVRVHYRHDTDTVIQILRNTASTLQQDPAYAPSILEALEVLGVEGFGESGVTIRIRIKTRPLAQWNVARELRRRIKRAFDDEGIEIPMQPIAPWPGQPARPANSAPGQ
jgi:small-conductance mechanosensitive channel